MPPPMRRELTRPTRASSGAVLVGLCSAHDCHKRLFGIVDNPVQRSHLALHEKTSGLAPPRVDASGGLDRGVGPMGGAERIVDIVAIWLCEPGREVGSLAFSPG